jgi:hypothetical protein
MPVRGTTARLIRSFRSLILSLGLILLLAESASTREVSPSGLNGVAQGLTSKLGADWNIHIVVADKNERVVSVERLLEPDRFIVTFDREFLSTLNEGEISAAIAHEIGHIWIFCHFPYLHTEFLANEIALEMVDRSDLESLYTKLQAVIGGNQTVEEFLASNIPSRRAGVVKSVN